MEGGGTEEEQGRKKRKILFIFLFSIFLFGIQGCFSGDRSSEYISSGAEEDKKEWEKEVSPEESMIYIQGEETDDALFDLAEASREFFDVFEEDISPSNAGVFLQNIWEAYTRYIQQLDIAINKMKEEMNFILEEDITSSLIGSDTENMSPFSSVSPHFTLPRLMEKKVSLYEGIQTFFKAMRNIKESSEEFGDALKVISGQETFSDILKKRFEPFSKVVDSYIRKQYKYLEKVVLPEVIRDARAKESDWDIFGLSKSLGPIIGDPTEQAPEEVLKNYRLLPPKDKEEVLKILAKNSIGGLEYTRENLPLLARDLGIEGVKVIFGEELVGGYEKITDFFSGKRGWLAKIKGWLFPEEGEVIISFYEEYSDNFRIYILRGGVNLAITDGKKIMVLKGLSSDEVKLKLPKGQYIFRATFKKLCYSQGFGAAEVVPDESKDVRIFSKFRSILYIYAKDIVGDEKINSPRNMRMCVETPSGDKLCAKYWARRFYIKYLPNSDGLDGHFDEYKLEIERSDDFIPINNTAEVSGCGVSEVEILFSQQKDEEEETQITQDETQDEFYSKLEKFKYCHIILKNVLGTYTVREDKDGDGKIDTEYEEEKEIYFEMEIEGTWKNGSFYGEERTEWEETRKLSFSVDKDNEVAKDVLTAKRKDNENYYYTFRLKVNEIPLWSFIHDRFIQFIERGENVCNLIQEIVDYEKSGSEERELKSFYCDENADLTLECYPYSY